MGEIIIIGDVLNIAQCFLKIDFYEQANHIRGPRTNFSAFLI
jgi:hypothetical protein